MKKLVVLFAVLISLLINSCEEKNPTEYINSIPKITISYPNKNSSISDSVSIKIEVQMNELKRVELYIDHSIPNNGVFEEPPYVYNWITQYYEDGSQHILQAKAYDAGGNSLSSKYVIVNVYRFMPSYLQAYIISDTLIELTWRDNSKFELGFEIEQKVNNSEFQRIAQVDSNVTQYYVTGNFTIDTTYTFRVRAFDENEFSGYSNETIAEIKLMEPINLDIEFISDTSAIFSWEDNNSFESTYVIEKRLDNYQFLLLNEVPANTTSTTVLDTFIAGSYTSYRIYATFGYYHGPPSYFPATTLNFPAPKDVSIEGLTDNSLELSWIDENSFESGFIITRSEDNLVFKERGRVDRNVLSFVDLNLDTTRMYYYKVKAYSIFNESIQSEIVSCLYKPTLDLYSTHPIDTYASWMTLSNDRNLIAFGGYTSSGVAIYVYETFTGNHIKTLFSSDQYDRIFEEVAISPDNRLIAAIGDNNKITIWDVNSGIIVTRFESLSNSNEIKFSPDGNYLIVESGGTLRFYNVTNWAFQTRIITSDYIWSFDISRDQNRIVTATKDQSINIWNFQGDFIKEIPASNGNAVVKINNIGTNVYATQFFKLIRWDVNSGEILTICENFANPWNFGITSTDKLIASPNRFSGVGLWDVSTGLKIHNFDPGDAVFINAQFTPDDKYVVGAGLRSPYYIWKILKKWASPLE